MGKMALILVDVQNDFCPGGALPVANGDRVVEPLNRAAERFAAAALPVVATRDWHPARTVHFQTFGGAWPVHCVQGSLGAAFHPALRLPPRTFLLFKGIDDQSDGYSAFDGVTPSGESLTELLIKLGIDHLCIGGLATDYCVRATVLQAKNQALAVTVLIDAIAGVDLQPGDSERALAEMQQTGARLLNVDDLLAELA